MFQILLADVSMSLDNVLAVAGAAHDRLWVLVTGLILSVALMGLAANLIAQLLERYRWIAWIGLTNRAVCRPQHDLAWRTRGRRGDLTGQMGRCATGGGPCLPIAVGSQKRVLTVHDPAARA